MKKLLLTGLIITGMSAVAQTPRLSLFEEFTGETCNPCAATNPGLNAILTAPTNTPKVVAIKWQVPIPVAPTPTWSLYKTDQAEIDWRYGASPGGYGYPSQWTSTTAVTSGINAAPTGLFDGQHQWVFGAASDHPYYVSNTVISTAQSYTSAFSVTMARAWDATFSSVNLTISITASAPFTAVGPLVFRTVMVEKQIHFATQPGTNGEKDFYDVAIASFPNIQSGTAMVSNWTLGQTQTFTLNCPLPSYTRDKSQVAFVGFIQDDGNRKVAQAVRANPQPVTNDAKAIPVNIPVTCSNSLAPTISVMNNGSNVITSFNINPVMNAVAGPVYSWAGSLAPGATTNITLPAMAILAGINTFTYNISNVSGNDNNLMNNTASVQFAGVLSYQGTSVAQGFAGAFPPANFYTYNNYAGPTWAKVTTCGGYGLSPESAKLDFYSTIPSGSVNELNLPPLHVGGTAPAMWFDVAYAQYTTENDQLDVFVSSDCGVTWTNVYSKAGSNLSTTAPYSAGPFTPSSSQWRTDTVQLSGYDNKDILVKFVGTSAYGNNLYLDNINLCSSPNISATSTSTNLCTGQSATITASGASTYSWSSGSQTVATVVLSPAQTQTVIVSSADPVHCASATTSLVLKVSNCTGIAVLSGSEMNVNIYPNPSNGETTVEINGEHSGKASVTVINTLGQVVYKKSATLSTGSNAIQFDAKGLASGLYNVVIDTEQGSTIKKLTVNK